MKTAKERLYRVDYAEEKLGDTVTKEMMNTSAVSYTHLTLPTIA